MTHRKLQLHISRLAVLALAVLLLLLTLPAAFAAEASGSCGSGVEWVLSGDTLTITGSGPMADYSEVTPAPWQPYKDSVRRIVVGSGVTSVGSCAFIQMDNVEAVRLANSVTAIGSWAFYNCYDLEVAELGGVQTIGRSAFERCLSLSAVRLPNSLRQIGEQAFYRCEGLMSITIPSSVTSMGSSAFAYCINLRSASVLAQITELPLWTFYGCEMLQSVSLTSHITSIGTQAFRNCDSLTETVYGGATREIENQMPQVDRFVGFIEPEENNEVDVVTTQTDKRPDGTTVVTDHHYTATENGSVNTTTVSTGNSTSVKVDAVLENSTGWQDVENQVQAGLSRAESVTVDIWLKDGTVVSGADLGRFTGQDVTLTIHTVQGATWHVNGENLNFRTLAEEYDLSYTLRSLASPDRAQREAVGNCQAFTVEFHKSIDFKVEVELPLGRLLARKTAVFFALEEDGYARAQTVLIDGSGIAHFYLARVTAGEKYLIGIDVPAVKDGSVAGSNLSDAIIPSTMTNEYPDLGQMEEIEYIITGVKSSWGIDMRQLTWIIVAVMGASVIVVGTVIFIMNKSKLKNGYVPMLDDEE